MWEPTRRGFEDFARNKGPGLRHAFAARYGPEVGAEVLSDSFVSAWEQWDRVSDMRNPEGWVYRVGQSHSRRYFRRPKRLPFPPPVHNPEVEPGLPACLMRLSEKQRVAVMLVHAFGYTVEETADILRVTPSTVQRNAARALSHLREGLGVDANA